MAQLEVVERKIREVEADIRHIKKQVDLIQRLTEEDPRRAQLPYLQGQLPGLQAQLGARLQERLLLLPAQAAAAVQPPAAPPGQGGPLLTGSKDQLKGALVEALREIKLDEEKDQKKQLSIAPSKASWSNMTEAADRRASPLRGGLSFDPAPSSPGLLPFSWPVNAHGDEEEVPGYGDAKEWLQQNVCPPGVQAVVVDKEVWLECKDDSQKLHLKPGKTDVVFVLDEYVQELQEPGATPTDVLLGIAGLAELKTNSTFQSAPKSVMAQAGVEHMSACFMLDQLLQVTPAQCKELGHQFVTVATDLSHHWGLFRMESSKMVMIDKPPFGMHRGSNAFLACAVAQTKAYLGQAADRVRAIHGVLLSQQRAPDAGAGSEGGSTQGSAGHGSGQQPATGASASTGTSGQAAQGQSHAQGSRTGSRSSTHEAHARLKAIAALAMADDDAAREAGARHSAALVSFLQHPLGFKGLLGLDKPPAAVCHPHLSELAEHPLSQHAALVRESIINNLG